MTAHTVPAGVPPMQLERYLRRAWPMLPGQALRQAMKRRDVRVNGVRSGPEAEVRGGDALALYIDVKWLEPEPEVLFSDGRLIALVKPQGLPVDVDREGVGADTLLIRLNRRWPGARLCHRLDAQTGGIVLAANDDAVWQQAYDAFENHGGVVKRYRALALNDFERREGTLRAYLKKDARRAEVRVVHGAASGGKPIETRYRVLERAAEGLYRVELEPVTGRTHQLRAHMADFGHPLLGDDHYGDRRANRAFHANRLCLWHARLEIPAGSPLKDYVGKVFECPAPDWLDS